MVSITTAEKKKKKGMNDRGESRAGRNDGTLDGRDDGDDEDGCVKRTTTTTTLMTSARRTTTRRRMISKRRHSRRRRRYLSVARGNNGNGSSRASSVGSVACLVLRHLSPLCTASARGGGVSFGFLLSLMLWISVALILSSSSSSPSSSSSSAPAAPSSSSSSFGGYGVVPVAEATLTGAAAAPPRRRTAATTRTTTTRTGRIPLAAASIPPSSSSASRDRRHHRHRHQRRSGDREYENDDHSYSSSSSSSSRKRCFSDEALLLRAGSAATSSSSSSSSSPSPSSSSSAWLDGIKSGLSSAMAAFCVKTILQPIDAIKTIQQYYRQPVASAGSSAAAAAATTQSLTVVQACREIVGRPGGIWNFYAGLGVTVFGAMPGVALYFGVYSYCKKNLLGTEFGREHKTLSIALSAAIGNTVASFSRVPYEVVKQQLQTQAYSSTWEAFSSIASSSSWLSLIFPKGGVAIQMLRDVPYAVVTLLLYESLQSRFSAPAPPTSSSSSHRQKNRATDFILGGVAGGFGSWVTNPMDVVKTRLQTDSANLYDGSIWKCASMVWGEGRASAFLRGSVPRLMHKIPANAFFFLFYEFFKRVLKVDDNNSGHGNHDNNNDNETK